MSDEKMGTVLIFKIKEYKRQIDQMGLTDEEIKIVEEFNNIHIKK